ncbi:MAG TPA: type II toxin-antitoxin system VapC family toxin [Verrucomicrobiae bacterium]|nr:type II toxin-antitoxin system VapC family toxin [Verrucomicrobiae bacterium]
MADKNAYWDACAWIGLINEEPDKYPGCKHTMGLAENGHLEIWTSAFTLAEVFKRKRAGDTSAISAAQDSDFEDFLMKSFIVLVEVDRDIGTLARALMRRYPIKQPQDGVHLATAVWYNLDEFHTFDGALLSLDRLLTRRDGAKLPIVRPSSAPPPGPLFSGLTA